MLRSYGIGGLFDALKASGIAWNKLMKYFGEKDTQLLASYSSMFNGCRHCGYGHLYALNLIYFDETGELFPIAEDEILEHMRDTDAEVIEWLLQRLNRPQFARQSHLLRRLYAIEYYQGQSSDPDDQMLTYARQFYSFWNECSIVGEAPSPPLGPVAKKRALIARYQLARQADRAARGLPPSSTPWPKLSS
jgi:hypothetical protein